MFDSVYLLRLVGELCEHIKDFPEVIKVVVVFACTEAHEIKEVFLVVQSHVDIVLLEDCAKVQVRNQAAPPVFDLALTLEPQSIQ